MLMPTDNVQLLIGGKTHGDWDSYEIDSDLMVPADGWHVSLGMTGGEMPPDVVPGAPVVLKVDGETVLTGRVDDIEHSITKNVHSFSLSGRDHAADLVDCSAPIFDKQLIGLSEVIAALSRPFGITHHRISADSTRIQKKINIEPGDTAWDALVHAAEANGLWPWFDPDGTLVVGGPDYSTPVVATLILRKSGDGNNVISLSKQESMQGRYSKVTVFGQTQGTHTEQGKNNLKGTAYDTGVPWYRPKIVADYECDNTEVCRDRARKIISDSRLNSLTLSAVVKGHHVTSDQPPALLWMPGQRVRVISEPHGIDAIYFVMARKFTRGRNIGTRTTITLKEDGVWVLDAHPHNNKHRRGKNSVQAQILNIPGAAQ